MELRKLRALGSNLGDLGQVSPLPWVSQLLSKVPYRLRHRSTICTTFVNLKAEAVPAHAPVLRRGLAAAEDLAGAMGVGVVFLKLSSLLNSDYKGKKIERDMYMTNVHLRFKNHLCIRRRSSHSNTHKSKILEQHRR